MPFHADLHVHSKYSRATSRELDLEHLAFWAARKGISVVATGDCVHPAWLAEIKEKLVPDGTGLFRLKPEIAAEVEKTLPAVCRVPVRFMLSTEISTIYKKAEKTRKIHHLILASDFATADALASRLSRVGNIASDGRPILGLDSRDLLEIALESGPDCHLVPAHIWTPWFAALGSQSGFDSIADCYADLAGHIFAVETGLSSDPAMNWRVSSLDGYRLVSNSDAHSPAKLGREATRFSCAPDYGAIFEALRTGRGYDGTVEFFPEEGKYHLDGHRACEVRLDPKETIKLGGICPVCGRPVTVGVAHRVEMLADRADAVPPATAGAVRSFVPLPEILSELLGVGAGSSAVTQAYDRVTAALGPEMAILGEVPTEEAAPLHPLLAEALSRLRAGRVVREAGYDGEYGVIRLFAEGELDRVSHGDLLFDGPIRRRRKAPKSEAKAAIEVASPGESRPPVPRHRRKGVLADLDDDQARAASLVEGPLAVIAGPGSGKTRMLTHRIAHLVREKGVPASACLAITFTRRATEELRSRLALLLGDQARDCATFSFHALGLAILRAHAGVAGLPEDFRIAPEAERKAMLASALSVSSAAAGKLLAEVSLMKRTGLASTDEAKAAFAVLADLSRRDGWVDFDDLVARAVDLLDSHDAIRTAWQARFTQICADEFQDVDEMQYRLLRLLAQGGAALCVIGDPDQAIYGFRGGDATSFKRFQADFPQARTVRLDRNYRSSGTVVAASAALIEGTGVAIKPMGEPVMLYAAANEGVEAAFVAATIEELMGGHDMLAAGRGGAKGTAAALGFADFAVLYRTDSQAAALREAFDKAGIPHKKSRPQALAGHAGVEAVLEALASQDGAARGQTLAERLEQAVAAAGEHLDAIPLAEAKGWLSALVSAGGTGEEAFREQVALATEADFFDARAQRVSLLTMHAAKGLEFPVVFVVGLEDGIAPLSFAGVPEDEAEERRLVYVAMTRAQDRLILTRAKERFWRGKTVRLAPSPYLKAVPAALTTTRAVQPKGSARQLTLF